MSIYWNTAYLVAGAPPIFALVLLAGGCAAGSAEGGPPAEDPGEVESALDPVPMWVASYGASAGGFRTERHPRMLADVDGDGRADIIGFGNAGAYVSPSTGSAFFPPALWVANYGYEAGGWRVDRHLRQVLDVNGDSLADIVGFGNAGVHVSLSTGAAFQSPERWVVNYGYEAGGWRLDRHPRLLGDVNGDGLPDVVGFGNDGAYVSVSTGGAFQPPELWVGNFGYDAGGWRVERHPRVLADCNGDGLLDIVGFGNDGAYVSLSTGSSFQDPELWVNNYGYVAGGWRVDRHPRFAADVNGDGRADIVGFGNDGAYVSLSIGIEFQAPELWVANYGHDAGGWRVDRHPRFVTDMNADGRADIVGFGDVGPYVSYSLGSNFEAPLLLVNNFGQEAGGWRVNRHPRLLADVTGDGVPDIVGFGDAGVYVHTN